MKSLQLIENAKLDIAITGESGSGKSTFVNAIRGLGDEDEGSAKTGVVETTIEPTPYLHPKFPNVTVWDLPGIGTETFQPSDYLEQVKFKQYDFFIIIATERFKSNNAELAREINNMGKKFYFARSKLDSDMHACKERRKANYDEEKIMEEIRQNCIESLKKAGIETPQVFLVSCFKLDTFEFVLLQETLGKELPKHKKHIFMMSIPNISSKALEQKKEFIKKEIWALAILSFGLAAVPVPGLSFACDLIILKTSLSNYCKSFGLDEESLQRLARKVNIPVAELKSVIKFPEAKEITNDLLVKLMTGSAALAVAEVAEEMVRFIPILGSVVAGGISFGTTFRMLNTFVNNLAEDAQRVLNRSLESSV